MFKALALTLVYGLVVSFGINHFFGHELSESANLINNNSGREMATILACIPGVWFFMDHFQSKDNSPE